MLAGEVSCHRRGSEMTADGSLAAWAERLGLRSGGEPSRGGLRSAFSAGGVLMTSIPNGPG